MQIGNMLQDRLRQIKILHVLNENLLVGLFIYNETAGNRN